MNELILETDRLVLRRPRQDDFDAWVEMMRGERSRFVGGPLTRPETWRMLAVVVGHWELRGFGLFAVVERSSGACIGRVGAWMPEAWPGKEVGWTLTNAAEGRGYAREAAVAALDWVFHGLGWTDVIHCIHPENARSIALAERLGSRLLRTADLPPPASHEVLIYGQSRKHWIAAQSA